VICNELGPMLITLMSANEHDSFPRAVGEIKKFIANSPFFVGANVEKELAYFANGEFQYAQIHN
jgi:hypothetical protein